MRTKSKDIAEQLRRAILAAGLAETGRLSGVDYTQLMRFTRRERGLTMTSAAKVARVLGLELRKVES